LLITENNSLTFQNIYCQPGVGKPTKGQCPISIVTGPFTSYPTTAIAGPWVVSDPFQYSLANSQPYPLWGFPIQKVYDMDLDTNNNLTLIASNYIPPNVVTLTVNQQSSIVTTAVGCYAPFFMSSAGSNSANVPYQLDGYPINMNNPTLTPTVGGLINSPNCQTSADNGIVNPDCGQGNNVFAYQQSSKLLRTIGSSPSYQFAANSNISFYGYPNAAQAVTSVTAANGTLIGPNSTGTWHSDTGIVLGMPALIANIHNASSSTGIVAAPTAYWLSNVYSNNPVSSGWTPSPYWSYPNSDLGWLLDYDCTATDPSTIGSSTVGPAAVFFYLTKNNQYILLYTPNIASGQQLVNLPGYFPSNGRVALSNQAIYFIGAGQCGQSGAVPKAPVNCSS
ncbi:hypothetical protein KDA11_01145, partial [Candidatus Saccharibacteria bacterium]|nr:hypothetical protein [Candidatus Saccharibacteria bacterium]